MAKRSSTRGGGAPHPTASIMLPKTKITFREFLLLQCPCRRSDTTAPQPNGLIFFEHKIELMPFADELKTYRAWKPGMLVNDIHYPRVGDSHVASFHDDAGNLTIVLNGETRIVNLTMSASLFCASPQAINDRNRVLIREAIEEHFAPRIRDFSRAWKCGKTGLFTLDDIGIILPLPKKFIPEEWSDRLLR